MIIENHTIKARLECYEGVLRQMAGAPHNEEDLDVQYARYCGAVWAFHDLDLITTSEAVEWVRRYAFAVDGAVYVGSVSV